MDTKTNIDYDKALVRFVSNLKIGNSPEAQAFFDKLLDEELSRSKKKILEDRVWAEKQLGRSK